MGAMIDGEKMECNSSNEVGKATVEPKGLDHTPTEFFALGVPGDNTNYIKVAVILPQDKNLDLHHTSFSLLDTDDDPLLPLHLTTCDLIEYAAHQVRQLIKPGKGTTCRLFYCDFLDRCVSDAMFGVNSAPIKRLWGLWPGTQSIFESYRDGYIRITSYNKDRLSDQPRFFLEGLPNRCRYFPQANCLCYEEQQEEFITCDYTSSGEILRRVRVRATPSLTLPDTQ